MSSWKILITAACGAMLAACAAKPKVGITEIDYVKLKVQGDTQPRVVFTSKANSKCVNKPDKRGCIVVSQYNQANIEFKLKGSGGWRFDKLEICEGGSKRGRGDPCNLTGNNREQFAVFVGGKSEGKPGTDGEYQFKASAALRKFNLVNGNRVAGEYYYRIRLCPINGPDSDCIWSDPPIINGGMGSGFF